MSTQPMGSEAPMSALEQFAAYPFDSDDIYQQGLASIIAGGALHGNLSLEERDEILLRTRVFYFNKMTENGVSMDEARDYERSLKASSQTIETDTQAENSMQDSPSNIDGIRILTFAELKDLIESGKVDQIPNNKIIPEAISDAPPSNSTASVRKKPWELT